MTEEIKRQLQHFFPGEIFSDEILETALNNGEIITDKEKILPYLQTALFDEKVLEVELDGMPRVYFSRLKDDLPDLIEDEVDGEAVFVQPDYEQGEYLTDLSHIVTLPLEPGLGNLHLRHSRFIVIRMFTSTFAVEMGSSFEELAKVQDIPVLRLAFPVLARLVRNAREFRAKVPENLNFVMSIAADEESPDLVAAPVDISVKGMSFSVSKDNQKMFKINDPYLTKLYLDDELRASIGGTVKHLSRIRKKSGIEYVCGVEFDLQTRTMAAVIESIVATVQRAHLKELAEKSELSGIDLIA
ncbi:MAG: hypothetical protein VR65_06400 [Desulfobulbaceae bacterium BRH_c16a]|nr:MAG: hypothetical protein VR65_25190 [Desulfobulbaceae bacterium BRH_c16a]KJS02261.1 MAG: hypothetical protein VR65_06400 [Desulfobulbaceae bacterium BRH_c16a]